MKKEKKYKNNAMKLTIKLRIKNKNWIFFHFCVYIINKMLFKDL